MVSSRLRVAMLMAYAALSGCMPPTPQLVAIHGASAPDAVVDARHTGADGARTGTVRTYRTLRAALAAATPDTSRYTILIRNGRYREKLTVERSNVSLIGESRDGAIITYDAASDTRDPDGRPYGTCGSFTLRVIAPGFRAENLTIENAFDYMANAAKAADDPTKLMNPQGVALMTDGLNDRAVFVNVRISGHQDTLFTNAGRHYFVDCIILGSVDFIFGAGQAVFEDCDIISRDRGSRTNNGYVTAPSTSLGQPYGFLFVRSRLKKDSPSMAPNTVVLGRPWHPAAQPGINSAAVYIDCWMDDHIGTKGWDRMSAVDSATTIRVWYEPGDSRFFEYRSSGPGGAPSPGRRMLTAAEAEYYTSVNVLRGWQPGR
jgi:pectinesterase